MPSGKSWKKVGKNKKKLKFGGGVIFFVGKLPKIYNMHGTKYDNSAYNSCIFSSRFARRLLVVPNFKVVVPRHSYLFLLFKLH